jgi:hypothetical protein
VDTMSLTIASRCAEQNMRWPRAPAPQILKVMLLRGGGSSSKRMMPGLRSSVNRNLHRTSCDVPSRSIAVLEMRSVHDSQRPFLSLSAAYGVSTSLHFVWTLSCHGSTAYRSPQNIESFYGSTGLPPGVGGLGQKLNWHPCNIPNKSFF